MKIGSPTHLMYGFTKFQDMVRLFLARPYLKTYDDVRQTIQVKQYPTSTSTLAIAQAEYRDDGPIAVIAASAPPHRDTAKDRRSEYRP
jgi:hypothetical protein